MMNIDGASNYAGYNVLTGQEIWKVSPTELPWGALPAYQDLVYNNGTLYAGSTDGHVYAIDVTNGNTIWKSDFVGVSWENPVGNQEFNGGAVGADGILYFSTYTQYSNQPRPRFHELVAINQTTGEFLWTLPIEMNPTALAYGYLVAVAPENGVQYCLGRGSTATTIAAPMTTVTSADKVLIQGTVMDMSPGEPNTPAVSDASMTTWMDYLFGQDAQLINSPPTNITGVPVVLSAIDPNGNWIVIGNVVTNAQGHYSYAWTPTVSGLYTVTAAFAGSGAYYRSSSQTALSVVDAAPTPAPTSQPVQSMADVYFVPAIAGLFALVAIIGVVLALLMLRKRT
jgi:hypothetical protein